MIGIRPASDGTPAPAWLASRVQVVLEDRDLDFAWSLSCVPQGALLSCVLPRGEIRSTYDTLKTACGATCSSIADKIARLNQNIVTDLQVWVEQFDPEANNAFGSHDPVALQPINVTDGVSGQVQSWQFAGYENNRVALSECGLISGTTVQIKALGADLNGEDAVLDPPQAAAPSCVTAHFSSGILRHSPLVLQVTQSQNNAPITYVVTVPSELIRPTFGKPVVKPITTNKPGDRVNSWTIDWSVSQASCYMTTDLPADLKPKWMRGSDELGDAGPPATIVDKANAAPSNAPVAQSAAQKAGAARRADADKQLAEKAAVAKQNAQDALCKAWPNAQRDHRLALRVTVNRSQLHEIPEEGHLVGVDSGDLLETLPSVVAALLPAHLKLESLGNGQYGLRGAHAGLVDAVSLSSGKNVWVFSAAPAPDFSVFSTNDTPLIAPTPPKEAAPAGAAAAPGAKPAAATGPAAGTYTVQPLFSTDDAKKQYYFIESTAEGGKPLVVTVPTPTKDATDPSSTDPAGTVTTTVKTTTDKTTKTSTKAADPKAGAATVAPTGGRGRGGGGGGSR